MISIKDRERLQLILKGVSAAGTGKSYREAMHSAWRI